MRPAGPTLLIPEVCQGIEAAAGDPRIAEARDAMLASRPRSDARIQYAADALECGRVQEAERIASEYLAEYPQDAVALSVLADIARRTGRNHEAELYLARCVQNCPDQQIYHYNYAVLLLDIGKSGGALAETELLLQMAPGNILYRSLKATILERSGKYADALPCYRELTLNYPDSAEFWLGLASTLRSLGGHRDESTDAFRKAAHLCPWKGKYWWNLASLKTFRFEEEDMQLMESQLAHAPVSSRDRADLHYALGKAHDDLGHYESSFRHYAKGNAMRRLGLDYDADETTTMVSRARMVYTEELFQKIANAGCLSSEPIFVLGLQRAGSTLIEQILGSHSSIESAGELPFVLRIVGDDVMPKTGPDYPCGMDRLEAADLRALGEKYLMLARARRTTSRMFFVDKCPFNLWHVGLIHMMLPNAKIIDARRHPIACCYANFTMSFAHAPPVSYRLSDIGRFYADYARLMAHFDRALPGRIHRVYYERLVADLETEVRGILEFLDLPFEPGCLEFHANERAFNSYSNEQVRTPIFTDSLEHWRNFDKWLGPLRDALGPVLDAYPSVPEFG